MRIVDAPFPYPLPQTLKIGEQDPLDYRWTPAGWVYDLGWWRRIGERKMTPCSVNRKRG